MMEYVDVNWARREPGIHSNELYNEASDSM
jgi:hypothetical protein